VVGVAQELYLQGRISSQVVTLVREGRLADAIALLLSLGKNTEAGLLRSAAT
jgi:hypothetical protein